MKLEQTAIFFLIAITALTSCKKNPKEACDCVKTTANEYMMKGIKANMEQLREPCAKILDQFKEDPKAVALISSCTDTVLKNIETRTLMEVDGKTPVLPEFTFNNASEAATAVDAEEGAYKYLNSRIIIKDCFIEKTHLEFLPTEKDTFLICDASDGIKDFRLVVKRNDPNVSKILNPINFSFDAVYTQAPNNVYDVLRQEDITEDGMSEFQIKYPGHSLSSAVCQVLWNSNGPVNLAREFGRIYSKDYPEVVHDLEKGRYKLILSDYLNVKADEYGTKTMYRTKATVSGVLKTVETRNLESLGLGNSNFRVRILYDILFSDIVSSGKIDSLLTPGPFVKFDSTGLFDDPVIYTH